MGRKPKKRRTRHPAYAIAFEKLHTNVRNFASRREGASYTLEIRARIVTILDILVAIVPTNRRNEYVTALRELVTQGALDAVLAWDINYSADQLAKR